MHYILEADHSVRPAKNIEEQAEQWKNWEENGPFIKGHPRVVDKATVGDFEVSTVFLAIDHGLFRGGPPILFETMVFAKDTPADHFCQRYATWDETKKGHDEVVAKLVSGELEDMEH